MVTAALVAARPSRSGRFRDTIRVFLAIRDRDHATVELLLRRDPTLASATEDWTPGEAITTGVGYAGKATALIRAAQTGDLGLVRLLVEAGALADGACACEGAETPLWSAVVQGNRDVVAYLLARVVDPNAPAFRGATPLHAAVQRGHDDLVPVLLAAGADPARTDDGGRAPSDWISARAARAGPRADAGDHVPTGIRAIDLFAPLFRGALQHWPPAYGLGQFVLLSALADHLRPAEFVHIGFSYGPYDPGGAAQEVNETGVPCVARLTPRDADPAEQRSYFAHALDEVTTHHGDQLVICLEAPGYLHDVAVALPALANSPSVVATIVVQPFTGSYPTPTADTPEGYHAQVVFDPRRARRALWPAVDPVHTTSRWWPSHRHAQLAEHVQQTFASYEAIDPELQLPDPHTTPDPALAATAQQLIRYLTQPFAITEPFTSEPGQRTPYDELLDTLEEALR